MPQNDINGKPNFLHLPLNCLKPLFNGTAIEKLIG
jgi:hypothetical protein